MYYETEKKPSREKKMRSKNPNFCISFLIILQFDKMTSFCEISAVSLNEKENEHRTGTQNLSCVRIMSVFVVVLSTSIVY